MAKDLEIILNPAMIDAVRMAKPYLQEDDLDGLLSNIGPKLREKRYSTYFYIPRIVKLLEDAGINVLHRVNKVYDYMYRGRIGLPDPLIIPKHITEIGASSLSDIDVSRIVIPSSVDFISASAFIQGYATPEDRTVVCEEGSEAERYCKATGIRYVVEDLSQYYNYSRG